MKEFLTKPGRWYVARENYNGIKSQPLSKKTFHELCEKDRVMLLEKTKSIDIKFVSFFTWLAVLAAIYVIIVKVF